uniref:Uncharacterized protein n=1 Tax=Setaria viridis TaxID=4556 RepID=A0A4U6UMD6_SETVI|nr:hypothetical protein SEVIR_5G208900v2 [Setaria viridis]
MPPRVTRAKALALAQAGVSDGTTPDSQELPTKGLHTKLPIHVREGLKWPEAPMQATKFASEGGIILRGHISILTHYKDYKAHNEKYLKDYIGKLPGQFDIETTSQPVIKACTDMLKLQQRHGRYRLKKKYFNGLATNKVPTRTPVTTMNDDQWNKLREKQVERDPTPIDLFKNFHCSKNGYTALVQAAIVRMEQIVTQPGDD